MATERAQQYQLSLGGAVHSFVMSMHPSHVTQGFWLVKMHHHLSFFYNLQHNSALSRVHNFFYLNFKYEQGLPRRFCEDHLPNHDASTIGITLVDLQGVRFEIRYIPHKHALSGGWKGFALQHSLIPGDALVFELTEPTIFRVSNNMKYKLQFEHL